MKDSRLYYCEYLSTIYTLTYISIHLTTYKKYFSFYFYIAKLYTNTFVSVYSCSSNFQVEYLHKQVRWFRGQNWVATTHFQLISRGSFRQHVAAFIQRNVAGESMSMKFLISKRKNERERERERERRGGFETGRAEFIEPVTIIRRIFVSGCARERIPDLPLTASITGRRVVWRVICWKMPVSRANARWKSGVIMASLTLHRALPVVTRSPASLE